MKIEKSKIVFLTVITIVLLFIIGYTYLVVMEDDVENLLSEPVVPKLESEQETYSSKLDAINDIKKERERTVPSLYNDKLLDSLGYYDRDFLEKEKERIVDSIYQYGQLDYAENTYRSTTLKQEVQNIPEEIDHTGIEIKTVVTTKELSLEHQLFFASNPKENTNSNISNTVQVLVEVDGKQIVKVNSRLKLRLIENIQLANTKIPRNTSVYGVVSFQPNRTLIKIENINHIPVKLKAFDIQDGLEGIYVENTFQGEATNVLVNNILDEINITGVPQVSGIKKIFKRNNRTVKVLVANNYKLLLKTQ